MPRADTLLIVNPYARHGETSKLLPVIEQLLLNLPHDTFITDSPGHAAQLAEVEGAGRRLVVAVGGDGTVHEVLNGLMRIPAEKRPAMGLLPTGSGNDSRRTFGVPADLARAALTLATGNQRALDVGICNGTYFSNSFAAGLDARVTAKAVEYKVTTKRSGIWLYLTALIQVLFHDLCPMRVRVSFDGEPAAAHDLLIVAMTIGETYGGGFRITPGAIPDDGLFEVCTIDPLTLGQALVRLPLVIAGKHTGLKAVRMSRHFSAVIESDEPIPAQIDGEVLVGNRFEISILPEAIEYIVPRED